MLSLSPPLFSPFGWALEDNSTTNHEQNYNHREAQASESFLLHFPSIQHNIGTGESANFAASGEDATVVKKKNHNASERDRRKKINSLYSSLGSLLPAADQTKKLSIPATVSRMLKYIPELQKDVQRLVQKKEDLILSRVNNNSSSRPQADNNVSDIILENQRQALIKKSSSSSSSSSSVVSASQLGDREVVIQISTTVVKVNNTTTTSTPPPPPPPPLSEVLLNLEENYGLLLLDGSVFESFGHNIFYNLHLQVQGTPKMKLEMLRRKLLSFYEKRE